MKKLNTNALGALALFISGLMLGACANTQIDTGLPESHPANPAAEAAVFVPPPNPFAMNASDTQPVRPPAGSGDHPKHQEGTEHGHEMQTMKPQSAAPAGSTEKNTEHQH
jgi:hypothetical protein